MSEERVGYLIESRTPISVAVDGTELERPTAHLVSDDDADAPDDARGVVVEGSFHSVHVPEAFGKRQMADGNANEWRSGAAVRVDVKARDDVRTSDGVIEQIQISDGSDQPRGRIRVKLTGEGREEVYWSWNPGMGKKRRPQV